MTIGRVKQYYDSFDEWARLESAEDRLEYVRTLAIIDRFLKPSSRVLDLGGGPGRYAIALAQRGHRVCLADLSDVQLQIAEEKIRTVGVEGAVESIKQVSATDLSAYPDASFDAVLALGPFYHLVETELRSQAAREIARALKAGGVIIAAFIPRLTGARGLFERAAVSPEQVSDDAFSTAYRTGAFYNRCSSGFQEGYYPTREEIRGLFGGAGITTLSILSIRGLANGLEDLLWRIQGSDPQLFSTIMQTIENTASHASVIDMGGHALYIGEKPEG